MAITPSDYRHLSVEERLQLVGDIWDSIAEDAAADPDLLPLSDEERAELDRRLAEHDADPGSAIPWEEAVARIRQELHDGRHEATTGTERRAARRHPAGRGARRRRGRALVRP